MIENIKLLSLNIKEYFRDILGLILIGVITNVGFHFFYWNLLLVLIPWKIDFFPLTLEILKVLVWITTYLILKWFWQEKARTWLSMRNSEGYYFNDKKNKITDEIFLKDWILQGNAQPLNGGLLITNSNSGCLIKPKGILGIKRVWKNFVANIEFEFPIQNKNINPFSPHIHNGELHLEDECNYPFENYLGVIFRAQNLDDYFMIEFRKIKDYLVLRPHLRIGGNWDVPILNTDVNLLLVTTTPILLNLSVKNNIATISIGEKSMRWIFPTHVDTNLIQQTKDKEAIKRSIIPEVYFRNRSGMFGFRCYGNQIAFVRSLEISPV